jgi:hypothetical protein
MKHSSRGTLSLVVLLLASCGGSGEGLDENGRPGTDNGSTLTPDLQSIQDNVFTPICTACHAGAAAPLGLRLDEASTFAMLVNAPSVEVPSILRVSPGNPGASYLIQKLEGNAAVGGRMPLNQPPLPQATINVIRQWIADGAAPAPAAAIGAITRLSAVVPIEAEVFTRAAGDPLIAADGALELGSINPTNLSVERELADEPDAAADSSVTGAKLEVRSRDPTVFALVIPPSQRMPGRYRVSLRGSGATPVVDVQGRPIADFVLQYTIEDLQ